MSSGCDGPGRIHQQLHAAHHLRHRSASLAGRLLAKQGLALLLATGRSPMSRRDRHTVSSPMTILRDRLLGGKAGAVAAFELDLVALEPPPDRVRASIRSGARRRACPSGHNQASQRLASASEADHRNRRSAAAFQAITIP